MCLFDLFCILNYFDRGIWLFWIMKNMVYFYNICGLFYIDYIVDLHNIYVVHVLSYIKCYQFFQL